MTSEGKRILLYLAPMAGITDKVFRTLCFEQGCDVATTEMISAQGFMTAPRRSLTYKTLLDKDPREGTLIAQIFGHDPVYMGEAAARLSEMPRFAGIDINMGCPATKVVGSGSGSALMQNPADGMRFTVYADTLQVKRTLSGLKKGDLVVIVHRGIAASHPTEIRTAVAIEEGVLSEDGVGIPE